MGGGSAPSFRRPLASTAAPALVPPLASKRAPNAPTLWLPGAASAAGALVDLVEVEGANSEPSSGAASSLGVVSSPDKPDKPVPVPEPDCPSRAVAERVSCECE